MIKKNMTWLIAGSITLSVTGCGGSGSSSGGSDSNNDDRSTGDNLTYQAATLDSSSYDDYTYFNLETGEALSITAEEAANSTEWHIGFKRYGVVLNGGDSGSGNVAGAIAADQENFYDAGEPDNNVFLNASPDDELEHLTADYDVTSLTYLTDEKASAITATETMTGTNIDMGWFNYNVATHVIALNDDNWWLLRSSAENSFAKFHATDLTYNPATGLEVTFEFDVQPAGNVQFTTTATFDAAIPPEGGEACFDFDTDTTVDCTDTSWDLKIEVAGRNWNLWTNSGTTANGLGGAFGPLPSATADTYTSAITAPSGRDIRDHYSVDKSAGIFEEQSWYAYNLSDGHQLWPNYRVYMIDLDSTDENSAQYAVQITSYYSNTGLSGFPTIRFIAQ